MNISKRALLRQIINEQFKKGINKVDLLEAITHFIDTHYPEMDMSKKKYLTANYKNYVLNDLAKDIRNEGGVELWKKKLMAGFTPVIGSLPKKKKKN